MTPSRRRVRHLLLAATLGLALAACGDSTGPELSNDDFVPELGIDLSAMTRTASGLYLKDLREGTGQASVAGNQITVHYEGWLQNGAKFDSSRNRGQPLTFTVGRGQVIRGWDEGLVGVRVGGLRRLVIPPHLAYGRSGFPPTIPGNAALVFEVELLAVQ
ncbi:MAG: FKBP-type peptidyl-prolyl cis-trans isomerase [Gemmatimonadetes bacterium]|nr:FKBP-type peptidyl-prolyl cis-trans isomerase [Gemmatimonadota bacterium]